MNQTDFRFGDCELRWQTRELLRGGETVAVEPRALELIHYLAVHRDRAVNKDELAEALWPGRVISDTVISQTVRKARAAVGDDGERQAVIQTLRGFGYRFVAEITGPAVNQPNRPVPGRTGTLIGSLLVIALAVALILFIDQPAHGPSTVVVAIDPSLNFEEGQEDSWLGDAIPGILSSWLNQADGLMLISAPAIDAQLRMTDSPEQAWDRLHELLGVDLFLTSELSEGPDGWTLAARLNDADGEVSVLSEQGGEPLELAMRIGRRLLHRWSPDFRHGSQAVLTDPWVAETFYRGVHAARHTGDPAHALSLFETVLDYAPDFDRARYESAVARRQMGQGSTADEVFRELLETNKLSDERLRRMSANALAVSHWHAGRLEDARPLFALMAEQGKATAHRLDQGYGLLNLGMVQSSLGEFESAETSLVEALQTFSSVGYEPGRAMTANSLGVLAWMRGDLEGSDLWHRSALESRQRLGNQRDIAQSLFNLGAIAASRLDWEESERLFEQARVIQLALGNQRRVALILANQGQNRAQRGQVNRGRRLMLDALDLARQTESVALEADVLSRLGGLELQADNPQAALDWFDQALAIVMTLDDGSSQAGAMLGRSATLRRLDHPDLAWNMLEQAGELFDPTERSGLYAEWLSESAKLMLTEDQVEEAEHQLLQAMELAASDRNLRRLAEISHALIDLYLHQRRFDLADSMLSGLPDEILAQGPLLMLQAELAWHGGDPDQAWRLMESAREILGERWQQRHRARLEEFRSAGTP